VLWHFGRPVLCELVYSGGFGYHFSAQNGDQIFVTSQKSQKTPFLGLQKANPQNPPKHDFTHIFQNFSRISKNHPKINNITQNSHQNNKHIFPHFSTMKEIPKITHFSYENFKIHNKIIKKDKNKIIKSDKVPFINIDFSARKHYPRRHTCLDPVRGAQHEKRETV
jgi:hypothetical protein